MQTWQRIKNDPSLLKTYFVREQVIQTIREYFKNLGFHEVFTPLMVPVPSIEPNLEVFETELCTAKGIKCRAFLISSPEYAHKKLLAAGVGSLFEITHSFRNKEEVSRLHSPEFTILEWYKVNSDYTDTMRDFENLFIAVIKNVKPKTDLSKWKYQGETYDLTLPWPRISVAEAFEKFAGIDTKTLLSSEDLLNAGRAKGYHVEEDTNWEQMFYQIFFNEIETKIRDSRKPYFVYDYPISQASLSRLKEEDSRFAERFEVFLAGVELGNCFSELTDAEAQHKRFEEDLASRRAQSKTDFPIDEDLVNALRSGMPETGGIAVGVDRLVMLAADVPSVGDTIFFPDNELFDL